MGLLLYSVTCLIFLLLLLIIYFTKQRIDSIENKIFSAIMVSNTIGLIIEICCYFTVKYKDNIPVLNAIMTKSLLVYYLLYISLFTIYVYIISHFSDGKYNNDNEYNKKVFRNCALYFVINSFITCMLPMEYSNVGGRIYSYGLSINYMYIVYSVLIISWIYILFKNIKNLKSKKYIPIFILVILGTIVGIVQHIYPFLTLMTGLDAYVTFIMYFTIENPDVKMLEQVELAKEQADKANAAKTDFLSSMSHEIRTPLNAINGFSNLIDEAQTLDEAKANAKDIINASDTLLEIVNGILDISKIEAGKLEIIESPYNAKETFESLAKLITPRMEERGLDFSYYIAPDLPNTLYGDHANVKKVVTNFLSNACKYTEKGFVRYEVNCINNNDNCKLIISVEDSGRGIKKENIDKLFAKFDRLDVERNTTVEGTGLGLAITKQLVELMGGKIVVHTVYGEGSKFTVMLDQKIEKTELLQENKKDEMVDLKNTRILLVDDNELNLKVATKMLERYGCPNVTQAHSGFECLDLVKDNEYDLILLDDMMPKMSGSDTLIELRKDPYFNTPVVALTANAISGMKEKYLSQGFDEYLAKPIEKGEFIRVLNTLLANKEEKQKKIIAESNDTPEEQIEIVQNNNETPEEQIEIETTPEEQIEVEITPEEEIEVEEPLEEAIEPIEEFEKEITESEVDEEQERESSIEIIEPPEIQNNEEFLRKHGVDMDKSLELLGDMEMYNMTFTDFEKELESKWSRIEQEKLSGDMENYAIDVHSLKSDCKYLGFYNLADVAYEHELKSKENDKDFVDRNFDRLEKEYEKVLNIVKEYKERI